MAVKQDINVPLLAFMGLVGSMLLLITVWGVEAWYSYEVDLLTAKRYDADANIDWIALREEQYDNIGDPVGNATIYAAAARKDEVESIPATFGYRYLDEQRQTAAVPIHVAMASIVQQYGGANVSLNRMREVDVRPVEVVNEAYADNYAPTEAEPQDAPHPEPQEESAQGEHGTAPGQRPGAGDPTTQTSPGNR